MVNQSRLAEWMWGQKAKVSYLMIAAFILLFTLLGSREIWTQEHRWADIVTGMFYRHDYLHPYLGQNTYYDKPLLSYWLIVIVAKLTGVLTTVTLRLPSAIAGLLSVWSIYRLGSLLKNKELGFLSGWLLLTTFYFVFWARTSSADMLNLAGTLFALVWYFSHRKQAGFFAYSVFFIILAVTSLCKGLGGAIVPLIGVFVDMMLQKSWKQHLCLPLFLSLIPAAVIYLLPFWASSHFGGAAYAQDGLYLVYRENILRYFKPFDHQGPIYTYFLYLPIYMMPWAVFFFPALIALKSRFRHMTTDIRWISWTLLLVFTFFTLSGSRRSYYVLPIVPFAILFTADWLLSNAWRTVKRTAYLCAAVLATFILTLMVVDIIPAWYFAQVGAERFAVTLKQEAETIRPWQAWQIVTLDAESKLNFYLHLSPDTLQYFIDGSARDNQTSASLARAWPILNNKPGNTIFVTRKEYAPLLQPFFTEFKVVQLGKQDNKNAPVAFLPIH